MNSFDEFYLDMADFVSRKSKDRSTKVGVVISGPDNEVRSTGYNGFPRGIDDNPEDRHERPAKYMWTEHAERNAIYNAARAGVSLKGCTLYLNFAPIPCTDCARAIIQVGITRIVGKNIKFTGKGSHWDENLSASERMLIEANVEMVKL